MVTLFTVVFCFCFARSVSGPSSNGCSCRNVNILQARWFLAFSTHFLVLIVVIVAYFRLVKGEIHGRGASENLARSEYWQCRKETVVFVGAAVVPEIISFGVIPCWCLN